MDSIGHRRLYPGGKAHHPKASGKSKTEARNKLDEILNDFKAGILVDNTGYSVRDAVEDWLKYGLNGRTDSTKKNRRFLAEGHVISALGARKLRDLTPEDVDKWLAEKAEVLSTSTLRRVRSILAKAVTRAQARDKVKRNVVLLCECPTGQEGRPSKALTPTQAESVLNAALEFSNPTIRAYVVVSLLTGARTEEMRALTWSHVDLKGRLDADPPVPASIKVWRSVRAGNDTKTVKSRRTLAMPQRCVDVLHELGAAQDKARDRAGERWQNTGLVFATRTGTELLAGNVRRAFRLVLRDAGLETGEWTPRELRHSFVSLLSDSGVPIEQISRLCGHKGTTVTELIYRHQLNPMMEEGATAMDRIFPADG